MFKTFVYLYTLIKNYDSIIDINNSWNWFRTIWSYSSSDAYTVPFETNISKALLVAGYTSSLVPDFATTVRE
jgi:hypothetical protein